MLTDRSKAKEGGFAQVREALKKFKGRVTETDEGKWGGQQVDEETGKPIKVREFFEVTSVDNEILESTEELTMDISEEFTFRTNCSESKNSFWVEKFLEAADRFKVLIPDGLIGKVVTWEKVTLESKNDPKFNATGFVIAGVEEASKTAPSKSKASSPAPSNVADPMVLVQNLAIGKTEEELKGAIEIDVTLEGTPVHPMAKAGIITQALIGEGKLVLVDGKYQIP